MMPTCDYHYLPVVQGGYHEGPPDPEGMDLAFRAACTLVVTCQCPCWPDGCPFLAEFPQVRCEPCLAHHGPDSQEVVVGHLYPPEPGRAP